jgi:hypothetical protein
LLIVEVKWLERNDFGGGYIGDDDFGDFGGGDDFDF